MKTASAIWNKRPSHQRTVFWRSALVSVAPGRPVAQLAHSIAGLDQQAEQVEPMLLSEGREADKGVFVFHIS
jgi:hypothetical protein